MTIKSMTDKRWGILNPYGSIWTPDTFQTHFAAKKHLLAFWGEGKVPPDMKIVPVNVTVETIEEPRP